MKIIVLISIFLSVALSDSNLDAVYNVFIQIAQQSNEECANSANITSEFAREVLLSLKIPNHLGFLSYIQCIYEKMGILQDGEVSVETVVAKFPYMTEDLTNKCVDMSKEAKIKLKKYTFWGPAF